MTLDFILQFQYTMYRRQSPACSTLYPTLRKCSWLHNWLKILVSLQGCSNENRKLGNISRRRHMTFGGYGYRNSSLASRGYPPMVAGHG